MGSPPLSATSGRLTFDGTRTPVKSALFLLVCLAWLLPGLVGHDPWKVEDALVFGVASEMLRTGDWVLTRVAAEPFLETAPLAYWAAAGCARLFGSLLPLHDAMRVSAGLFMAATLVLVLLTARELQGERAMRVSVLLFIGCLGLLIRAHEMSTELAALPGVALALFGLALSRRLPRAGGVAGGAGAGLAFLGDGLLPLSMVAGLMLALPLAGSSWRTAAYGKTVAIAAAAATPFVGLWFWLLASALPAFPGLWLAKAAALRGADGSARGPLGDIVYFARLLPWYAWPAWPLAAWSLWKAGRGLGARGDLLLAFTAFLVFFVVLSLFAEPRESAALVLLIPLSLLGVAEIDSLRRGAASALDWFGVTTFFLAGAAIWLLWIASLTGSPEGFAAWIARESPGPRQEFRFLPFAFAALLTLIWLVVVARSLRSPRRAIVNWSAGITMVWALAMALGLPLIDRARSYRGLAQQMMQVVPVGYFCAIGVNVGEAQRALLYHYAGLRLHRLDEKRAGPCGLRVVQFSAGRDPPPAPGWIEIWRGSRPGDRAERFALYRRDR